MHLHEMTISIMGEPRPAAVRYDPDPADGYPTIRAVEIARALNRDCAPGDATRAGVEHVVLDIYPILDAADLLRLEHAVCEARPLWRGCA